MSDVIKDIVNSNLTEGQVLLELKVNARRDYVCVIIDSENGITLKETTGLSRKLKLFEKFNSELAESYRLEISTPGIDRALEYPFQYRKNIDRNINIKFVKNGTEKKIKGKIVGVNNESVTVSSRSGNVSNVSYDSIESAKIKLSFK